jgi:hypothetical protein
MRRLLSALIALFGVVSLMLEVGPHDAATNFCNWILIWRDCPQSLPGWFSQFVLRGNWCLGLAPGTAFNKASHRRIYLVGECDKRSLRAARNTDIGLAAERMNTNGVAAWFTYYYQTQGIPIYGNVRNSTRIEPVVFKNIDIKVANDKLVGKEIHGALIWENLQVKKSDQKRLLKILKEHARALRK